VSAWWADRPLRQLSAGYLLTVLAFDLLLAIALATLAYWLTGWAWLYLAVGCGVLPALDLRARRLR
jgi:hypothetical protein